MQIERITAQNAPAAIGPYSHGIKVNSWREPSMLYTSGQLGVDSKTGQLPEDVSQQTKLALDNLWAVLQAGGVNTLGQVVKTTVFLANMDDFQVVNTIYSAFFGEHKPARSCVQVSRLPKDALVEIEAIAIV